MTLRISDILLAAALTVLLPLVCFCSQDQYSFRWQKQIVPGIIYSHLKKSTDAGPLHVHILSIDLNNPKIKVMPSLAKGIMGNIERTSDIAISNNAIAAINGSFFDTKKKLHLPVGFMVIDGQVVSKSILQRTAVGITKDKDFVFGIIKTKGYVLDLNNKKSVPIWGVNRPRKKDEVIIYTDEYGETTGTNAFGKDIIVEADGSIKDIVAGNAPIPKDGYIVSLHGWSRDFAAKAKISDKIGLVYGLEDKWKDVEQAITGGPLLVRDGLPVRKKSIVAEKFRHELLAPNSRTAIGYTKDKNLILVVVDRQQAYLPDDPSLPEGKDGVTYIELAEIMKDAGAENAIGLDGGHTSTMYINGRVVNAPSRGSEGLVSNAILVKYDGWKLASIPPAAKVVRAFVYKPPSDEMVEAIMSDSELSPTTYIPKPEDYGLYGLYDIYNRVIKPLVPASMTRRPSSGP